MNYVLSFSSAGGGGFPIHVECRMAYSLPGIVIVGFANRSVGEAKERIRGALASCRIQLPPMRIVINLSPADIPKEGSSYDLPMLISILITAGMIKQSPGADTVVIGEVGLDGSIKPIRGIVGIILSARQRGLNTFWIPQDNLSQAKLIPGIRILPFKTIEHLLSLLSRSSPPDPSYTGDDINISEIDSITGADSSIMDIAGQEHAKRALAIAAAGNHNIILTGPPGTGKTMLAKSLPGIMPPLTAREVLEVTHLHSLSTADYDRIITWRPFRSPHHSASLSAVIGGGPYPRPGEISLGHCGVVLMDEFPEFSRSVLESLRQPLEDKAVTITRNRDTVTFPADFLLVATSNPCPCGYGRGHRNCSCTPFQISAYEKKLSGPILDRIDLFAEVDAVPYRELLTSHNMNTAAGRIQKIRAVIRQARDTQRERSGMLNGNLPNDAVRQYCPLDSESRRILETAAEDTGMSARSYIRCLRVARTIADMDSSDLIEIRHVTEALQYRQRLSLLTSVL